MEMCHIVPGLNTDLIEYRPYAMCLAQFVMADDEYAEAYAEMAETHVILDNGLAEDGQPLKVSDLATAVSKCLPNEVVLPDYLDPLENTNAAEYALQDANFLEAVDGIGAQLMYVPHGNTLHEYAGNVMALTRFDRLPDSFGISKFHDKAHPLAHLFGRAPLAFLVKAYFPDKPLHYLGLGGPVQELRMLPNGRSCDTCYAFMAAAHGLRLRPTMLHRPAQVSYDHTAMLTPKQGEIFRDNVGLLDSMVANVEQYGW